MTSLVGMVRRSLWLVLLLALGGAAFSWWRDRTGANPPGPAEWPPLEPDPAAPQPFAAPTDSDEASDSVDSESVSTDTDSTDTVSGDKVSTDTGSADTDSGDTGSGDAGDASTDTPWVEPADDGSCPLSHPIKANANSGIFHVPDGRFYARTKAERCYATADDAVADGYRRAKN